ncbi:aminoglycoside phosphotransferase [Mycolicibacterium fortuitum subsp. fortuitum DSM 46621 = ATCC 6841 = JCM 6387]|uniref:Aminoglycoside phosphotransferase n=1 Tax=Mycolicibacterium fortuitum subsp. fortuitum DSM 46621 = ATCC 6841 = JCM 6387 TaxID=1214102 RepID=K0UIE6_MYCFO|nr:phosphotransferase family protein [Mycolicibacterium fortuitum]EJZ06952.1 aminoglycoside phosphotransferase [Mycolicibacterium fortuitum subsp. fortuitum DSM 46621 = ATCC 6841 = JCM 6387]BDE00630.1 acyl-CoA dehydrogenase [Mycolicibacterium fortuitum subsp. fortuitum]CRL52778.1 acyl-CoA dehydrogenase [Mycolicibacterium fortuitum subsp. fortuitum DSM 46621 = ATCC 6841 = JCM 6387]CRL82808.1 acyl-CoA dehydrogenase [Mycolicibacter nonchromogenicus]
MNYPQRGTVDVIGIDSDGVERWFAAAVPDALRPLSFELIAGGRSNLTYRVVDSQGHSWVLRRPPVGPLAPGAHSMEREWRILTALQASTVPVPPTTAFCAEPEVTGAEFYVMDHVDGIVVDNAETAAALSHSARHRLGSDIVATLADLHRIDPGVVGRRRAASTRSHVRRQLDFWMGQMTGSGAPRTPEILDVHSLLCQAEPPQRWTSLTHGDFRLGNVLVAAEAGTIAAVLDWELWTVGDPLADLGWLAAWWALEEDDGWVARRAAGFPTVSELAGRYWQLTGRDTSDLPYYMSFALWRLACIAEGVYERYATGKMGRPTTPLAVLAARPRELATAARTALA